MAANVFVVAFITARSRYSVFVSERTVTELYSIT